MLSTIECDNKKRCHTPLTIAEDLNAMRVVCMTCWHTYIIRKDPYKGNPEKRQYVKIFRKDALQGNDNLFYKYYPQFMRT